MRVKRSLIYTYLLVVVCWFGECVVYYVQNSGTGDCSKAHPCGTIGEALALCDNNDVIHIDEGYYAGMASNNTGLSLNDKRNITLKGAKRYSTMISCKDDPMHYALLLNNATDISIQDLSYEDCRGHGIMLDGSSASFKDVRFINNYSPTSGGALLLQDSKATILRGEFSKNHAVELGGGVAATLGSTVILSGTSFTGNTADGDGGAVYMADHGGTFRCGKCQFSENSASNGGGIFASRASVFELEASVMENNRATVAGGAIYDSNAAADSKHTITHCNFTGNTVNTDSSTCIDPDMCSIGGGGLRVVNISMVIEGSKFTGNGVNSYSSHTSYGGAVHASYFEPEPVPVEFEVILVLVVNGSIFEDNFVDSFSTEYSASRGGAVACWGISLDSEHSIFRNNTASSTQQSESIFSAGGALYISSVALVSITDVNFTSNSLIGGFGGAIHVSSADEANIKNVNIVHNMAISSQVFSAKGGGLYVIGDETDEMVLTRSNFTDNLVVPRFIYDNTGLHVLTSSWGGYGGGLYSEAVKTIVSKCIFLDNVAFNGNYEAITGGGGIAFVNNYDVQVQNSTFLGNHAIGSMVYNALFSQPGAGGGVLVRHANVVIENSYFKSNVATASGARDVPDTAVMMSGVGGGLGLISSKTYGMSIKNSTFEGNFAFGAVCNEFKGVQSGSGGGLAVLDSSSGGKFIISDVKLEGNVGVSGFASRASTGEFLPYPAWGGGLLYTQAVLDLTNVHFTENAIIGGGFGMDWAALPVAEQYRLSAVTAKGISLKVVNETRYDTLVQLAEEMASEVCESISERVHKAKSVSPKVSIAGLDRRKVGELRTDSIVIESRELSRLWVHPSRVDEEAQDETPDGFFEDGYVVDDDRHRTPDGISDDRRSARRQLYPSSFSISGTNILFESLIFDGRVHFFFGDEQEFYTHRTYSSDSISPFLGTEVELLDVKYQPKSHIRLSCASTNFTIGRVVDERLESYSSFVKLDQTVMVNSNVYLRDVSLVVSSFARLCNVLLSKEDIEFSSHNSTLVLRDVALGNNDLAMCQSSEMTLRNLDLGISGIFLTGNVVKSTQPYTTLLVENSTFAVLESGQFSNLTPTQVVTTGRGEFRNVGRVQVGGDTSEFPDLFFPSFETDEQYISSLSAPLVVRGIYNQSEEGTLVLLLNNTAGYCLHLESNETFLGAIKIDLMPGVQLTLYSPDEPSTWERIVSYNQTQERSDGLTKKVLAPEQLMISGKTSKVMTAGGMAYGAEDFTLTNMACMDINVYYQGVPSADAYSSSSVYLQDLTCYYCTKNSTCGICANTGCNNLDMSCGSSMPQSSCCQDDCSNNGQCKMRGSIEEGTLSYACVCNDMWAGDTCAERSQLFLALVTIPSALFLMGVLGYLVQLQRMKNKAFKKTVQRGVLEEEFSPEDAPYILQLQQDLILKDVMVAYNEISIERTIGQGSFGSVHLAIFKGERVALKKLKKPFKMSLTREEMDAFNKEACLMYRLRHSNIVMVKAISLGPPDVDAKEFESRDSDISGLSGATKVEDLRTVCILTEYLDQGALSDLLYGPPTTRLPDTAWNYELVLRSGLQAAKGMFYLHSQSPRIIHRDLKCANLVVNSHWVVKVTDFGMSRTMPWEQRQSMHVLRNSIGAESNSHNPMNVDFTGTKGPDMLAMTGNLGTARWTAPEMYTSAVYDLAVDSYSFGIVLWELYYRKLPFSQYTNRFDIADAVKAGERPPLTDDVPEDYKKLMLQCWDKNPNRRPRFADIVEILNAMVEIYMDGQVGSPFASDSDLSEAKSGTKTLFSSMPQRSIRQASGTAPTFLSLGSPGSQARARSNANSNYSSNFSIRNTMQDLVVGRSSSSSLSTTGSSRPFPVAVGGRVGISKIGAVGSSSFRGDSDDEDFGDGENSSSRSSDVGRSTNATDDANAL